jgi:poly-gamma-glutamate synthesis protein (capsule biosynthesis protein)
MKIALLGDICLTGKFDLESNPEAFSQFDQVKSALEDCDLVVGNLESPFTNKASSLVCKAIHIKSPAINTRLLQYLGINAVSLANNHIFDYGHKGYRSTLAALEDAGIGYFGTENQTLTMEKAGEKVMFGGFCCLSTHPSKANDRGVNTLGPASFEGFLKAARTKGAFPVTSVHWGDENIHFPREEHVRFAREMALSYHYLLQGHHPHVVHGLESSGQSLLAYSLGNFCTDQHASWAVRDLTVIRSAANRESFILKVTIEDGQICNHEVLPIVDEGTSIIVNDSEVQSKIKTYSAALSDPYSRPTRPVVTAPRDSTEPARFSPTWLLRRLNYHFIGAYLKGIKNRIRYRFYFSKYSQSRVD